MVQRIKELTNWWNTTCDFCTKTRPVVMFAFYTIGLLLASYGAYQLYFWWSDDQPAVEFSQGIITPKEARPGELLIVHQPVKKLRDCKGEVHRVITGDCGHLVVWNGHTSLKAGFNGRLTIPFQVPQEAIPGDCGFRVYARYWCNPFDVFLNRQVWESPLIPFEVKAYDDQNF